MTVAQIQNATRKPQFVITYNGTNLAANTTGTLVRTGGAVERWHAPYDGSVYALGMAISGSLGAGSITIIPMVGTTPDPDFTLTMSTAEDTSESTTQNGRKTTFNAGDLLYMLYTTSAGFLPDGSIDAEVDVYVLLEGVEL
jgi:hypothetical protein